MSFLRCKKCQGIYFPQFLSYRQLCPQCTPTKGNDNISIKILYSLGLLSLATIIFLNLDGPINYLSHITLYSAIAVFLIRIIEKSRENAQNEQQQYTKMIEGMTLERIESSKDSTPMTPHYQFNPMQWAKKITTFESNKFVILDCETTGLGESDEIIQLAIINMQGEVLFDSLIKPSPRKRISPDATKIHGISRETLKDSPSFGDILGNVQTILNGKNIITYNASYDRRLFLQTVKKYPHSSQEIEKIAAKFVCAMKQYSEYIGEWSEYKKDYKWQKLPGGDHTALGDCLATLEIIKKMAST